MNNGVCRSQQYPGVCLSCSGGEKKIRLNAQSTGVAESSPHCPKSAELQAVGFIEG